MAEVPRADAILVVHVSRIGDTMLVTPVLRAIAAAWPGARLEFLGHPKRAEVIRHLPFIYRVGTITKHTALFRGRVSGKFYDLTFVFGHDRSLIEYALRVSRRVIAFRQTEEALNQRLYRIAEKPAFHSVHWVEFFLRMLAPLGVPQAGYHLSYRVTDSEQHWALGQLRIRGVTEARPLIGLQVASFPTRAYRDWPIERFVELCKLIRARYSQAHFLIFGGNLERERTAQLSGELQGYSSLYAGRLTLRQTAALMDQLDLYVGVDTGPTHIMGALHRPMVVLYHGYSPSRLLAPLDHPCLYAVDHPDAGPSCTPEASMAAISVEHVWSRVAEALERHYAHPQR